MSNITLMAVDPGINTGITVFKLKEKKIYQFFLKYNNSKEAFIKLQEDLISLIDLTSPTHFIVEFTRFGKALHSTLSHFGLIALMYSVINNREIKWLNGLDKTKDSWGANPTSINAWCADKAGVSTKQYDDKESIKFAISQIKRLKKAGWSLETERLKWENNEHVADSLGIGLYTFSNILKESI